MTRSAPEPCTLLAWDSDFFGFPVAKVAVDTVDDAVGAAVLAWCETRRVRCVYFLADPNHDASVAWAERAGFHMVDIRVTMTARVSSAQTRGTTSATGGPVDAVGTIRAARPGDESALLQIAEHGYEDTRFSWDKHFDDGKARALYRTWIERSIAGWSDRMWVLEKTGAPLGFVTVHFEGDKRARIGLVGIQRDAQGRGVGRALLDNAIAELRALGRDEVDVSTQGRNVAAQALYQSAGFRASGLRVWYHRWWPVTAT